MKKQQWSKLKKHLESFLCESLQGRVQFHIINYRKAHDQLGRACITVDKREAFNMCTLKATVELYYKEIEIKERLHETGEIMSNLEIQKNAYDLIHKDGFFAQYEFFKEVEEYFQLPIESALQSNNTIIKVLTLLDRRVGKRTLQKLRDTIKNETEIVQYFYKIRLEAETMKKG
ncbi:hypothetical protein BAMA_16110 [Bacillus manliponensis]|uniref:Uncharacterized protein n=1 Tax=Bacillus manliponensis TaxID=574376 RepID=A0A073JSN6_9BACI|nr:hypothetical protein [Bacillus manliponensis]KEK17267.1 hypothetical protein BAMA_16110 [Bacillus manliponensis]